VGEKASRGGEDNKKTAFWGLTRELMTDRRWEASYRVEPVPRRMEAVDTGRNSIQNFK